MPNKFEMPLLERIYSGRFFPAEEIVLRSEEYDEAVDERDNIRERLERGFTERQSELLEDFTNAYENTHRLELQNTYAEGVRFGVRFLLEVLGKQGEAKNEKCF